MIADAPRVHDLTGGALLSYGPSDGPQLIVLQPLFEEMNRCRALVVAVCRTLAARGIGCWLPDLPGTGESPLALEEVGWDDWHAAVIATADLIVHETGSRPRSVAIRGGALLDGAIDGPRWRLSPVPGASLLTDLRRSALASGSGEAPAGYTIPPALAEALQGAVPDNAPAIRTIRLTGDARPANAHVDGPALWRRSEPASDAALAALLADDMTEWTKG
jgi:hypothetical protein